MENALNENRRGMAWGSFIADALSMPVHWYYHLEALRNDYGTVREYLTPKNPHADSILWRSSYEPQNEKGDILHEQAAYWGQHGVHYHQFLRGGENTLNLQLAKVLAASLADLGRYDADDYLRRYIAFMLTPGQHRDTYVEECHRKFFTSYSQGKAPRKCAGDDIHIGGLAHVGVLCAFFGSDESAARAAVKEHISLTHRSGEVLAAGDALVRILSAVADGNDLRLAILTYGSDWLSGRTAKRWADCADEVVVGQRVSSACYIADAFPASLYLGWKYAGDFEGGVSANANVGADNCHRGAVIGAMLGGAAGQRGIPRRFLQGLHDCVAVEKQINEFTAISPIPAK